MSGSGNNRKTAGNSRKFSETRENPAQTHRIFLKPRGNLRKPSGNPADTQRKPSKTLGKPKETQRKPSETLGRPKETQSWCLETHQKPLRTEAIHSFENYKGSMKESSAGKDRTPPPVLCLQRVSDIVKLHRSRACFAGGHMRSRADNSGIQRLTGIYCKASLL